MIRSSAMCCRTVNNLLANFLERSCRSVGLVSDQSRPHAEIIIVLHSTELFRAQPARAGALHSLGASAGHGEIGAGVSDLKALCASAERGRRRPDRRPRTTRNVERSAPPRRRGVVRPGEPPCARAPPSTAARHLWKPLVVLSLLGTWTLGRPPGSSVVVDRSGGTTQVAALRLRLAPSSRVSCVT